MNNTIAHWDSRPPSHSARVRAIHRFDARGMHRVYGRGDRFGSRASFIMDIWTSTAGRLLMRFWSHCADIEERSFEIEGVPAISIPPRRVQLRSCDAWIPKTVRAAYDQWIKEGL
jgi:hypothetical protein